MENYRQFSLYLFYIKNGNIITIYNNKKIRLGTFTQNFDEQDKEGNKYIQSNSNS